MDGSYTKRNTQTNDITSRLSLIELLTSIQKTSDDVAAMITNKKERLRLASPVKSPVSVTGTLFSNQRSALPALKFSDSSPTPVVRRKHIHSQEKKTKEQSPPISPAKTTLGIYTQAPMTPKKPKHSPQKPQNNDNFGPYSPMGPTRR